MDRIDEIRARCEAAKETMQGLPNTRIIPSLKQDILTLLDALDEAKAVKQFIRDDVSISDLYKKIRSLEDSRASKIRELKKVNADRDRWKSRAKALERALRDGGIPCDTCQFNAQEHECAECHECIEYEGDNYRWQFDEARFGGGEG